MLVKKDVKRIIFDFVTYNLGTNSSYSAAKGNESKKVFGLTFIVGTSVPGKDFPAVCLLLSGNFIKLLAFSDTYYYLRATK